MKKFIIAALLLMIYAVPANASHSPKHHPDHPKSYHYEHPQKHHTEHPHSSHR